MILNALLEYFDKIVEDDSGSGSPKSVMVSVSKRALHIPSRSTFFQHNIGLSLVKVIGTRYYSNSRGCHIRSFCTTICDRGQNLDRKFFIMALQLFRDCTFNR